MSVEVSFVGTDSPDPYKLPIWYGAFLMDRVERFALYVLGKDKTAVERELQYNLTRFHN